MEMKISPCGISFHKFIIIKYMSIILIAHLNSFFEKESKLYLSSII